MICSGGGGGWCPESSGDWPKVTQRQGRGSGASRTVVFQILTPLCTVGACAPAGNTCSHPCRGGAGPQASSPQEEPGCLPLPGWDRGRPPGVPGQECLLPDCSRARGVGDMVLCRATAARGPLGILQPESPTATGEAQTPHQGRGEEQPSQDLLAEGRKYVGLASAVPGGSPHPVVRGRPACPRCHPCPDDSGCLPSPAHAPWRW